MRERRGRRGADRVERAFRLEPAKDHARPKAWSLDRADHERAERGATPARVQLGAEIGRAIERGDGTRERFAALLAERGVQVRWNHSATTGRISGASFALCEADHRAYKGSELGYRWAELERRIRERAPARWDERAWRARDEGRERDRGKGRGR